jgi:membrane-associated phospholipid phosphatase
MNVGADQPGPPASMARTVPALLAAAAIAVVILGLLGLDDWFYHHVSLKLETKDRPFDRDFYTITKPFWFACRYAFAHIIGATFIFAVVLLAHPKGARAAAGGALCVLVVALAANLAKSVFGRMRPNEADGHLDFAPLGSKLFSFESVSFPSGEAAMAFALACVLARLAPRWKAAFYVAASLAAVSRLVNGAHYLSDVVAGALLGVVLAGVVYRLIERNEIRLLGWLPAGHRGMANGKAATDDPQAQNKAPGA